MDRKHGSRPRGGLTLIELLLVLAVLVVIAGIAWPSVMRFAAERDLKEGAERVRSALANTRLRAVDSSTIWQFRFEPEGRQFVALPLELDVVLGEGGSAAAATALDVPPLGRLGEGVRFRADATMGQLQAGEVLPDDMLATVPNAGAASSAEWSPAVRFFPDGSADAAQFAIVAEDGKTIHVGVQPLTGAVVLSDLE